MWRRWKNHEPGGHTFSFALAGNPNAGKTSVFNALTGAHQHVGNYPGVTVERKEGMAVVDGHRARIVDLPGTYSLTAYSLEELVARNYIIGQRPEVLINVVDAANLERNLYLTVQLLELGAPVVLCLNMVDVAEQRGIAIDVGQAFRGASHSGGAHRGPRRERHGPAFKGRHGPGPGKSLAGSLWKFPTARTWTRG